ncbi:unnamed protein product, partial [Didymodactylos carnosus]
MGIPDAYVNWIYAWLVNRRAVIEIASTRSRWFKIARGGPQGSSFTATLFITYHADMEHFIPAAMSSLFADDLAAVLAGQIGIKFRLQCIDVERRLKSCFKELEYYSQLTVQPLNYVKTKCMYTARAINYPNPLPDITGDNTQIEWVKLFKYLGYWISTKLGWGYTINQAKRRIRQQVAMVNSIKFSGTTSVELRRTLFSTFVMPYFTGLFAIYPLFTNRQREDLSHF